MENSNQSGKKKYLLAVLIVFLIGALSGVFYIDAHYGNGQIKTYFYQYFTKQSQGKSDTKKDDSVQEKVPQEQAEVFPDQDAAQADEIELNLNSKASFCTFGKEFLICTKDGVKYFREMKDQKWNDTFTMTTPLLVKENTFAAVGDIGGRSVHVYDASGLKYSIQTEGAVVYFSLNSNGYLAVISKAASAYKVMIYKEDGSELKGRVEETEGVYPLSVDISDDNKIFAVSYLDSSDIEPMARVLFFYIGEQEGENYTDSMFAAVEKEKQVIPMIAFMEDGILAAASDSGIYGMDMNGKEVWSKEWSNYVDFIQIEKKYIAVALGGELPEKEGKKEGTVEWINQKGKETGSIEGSCGVSYLKSSQSNTVIGYGKKYYGVNENGSVIWEYSAPEDVYDILPMENNTNVLYITKKAGKIVNMDEAGSKRNLLKKDRAQANDEKVLSESEKKQTEESTKN